MEMYLYGAGRNCKVVMDRILKYYPDIDIQGIIDNYKTGSYEGIKILTADEVKTDSKVIITLSNPYALVEVCQQLKHMGFKHIYWCHPYSEGNKRDFLKDECIDAHMWGDLIFPYVELHISDKCNLNCRACAHFSPLYTDINADLSVKLNDIRLILKKFSTIAMIKILGGEPLLNEELDRYVVELRKMLPNTFINIVTNGILIPQLSDKTLEAIRNSNVVISITEYNPTVALMSKILDKLKQHNILYNVFPNVHRQKFNKPLSINSNSKHPRLCISEGCITVADGLVTRCPTLMYVNKVNDRFGTHFPTDGMIRLDNDMTGEQILEELKKEVPLCKHCIKYEIDWSVCGKEPKLDDFVVMD